MDSRKNSEFEKYYIKYYPRVHGYILKKIYNESVAEDLTTDVFCACWEKFDSFDESKASFQTWLFVIVNNRLKNYYRDRKDIVELDESLVDDADLSDDVLGAIQLQILREHLYNALNELNETQRTVVIYRYFKDMNASEISYHLGLSPGNVRAILKRSLEKIKVYFDENKIRWE